MQTHWISRWTFFSGLFLSAWLLFPETFDSRVWSAVLVLVIVNIAITFWEASQKEENHRLIQEISQFVGFVIDSLFLTILIAHTGGLTSPYQFGYFYLILLISENGNTVDVVIYGLLFHFSYVLGLYEVRGDFSFYREPQFVLACLFYGFIFIGAVRLANKIRIQVASLSRSRTELQASQQDLEQLSIQDPVTGLYNFRYFSQLFQEEIQKAQDNQLPLALLIIDIDDFRRYNDVFGHQAGNKVLQDIAGFLSDNGQEGDILARYSGDSYLLLLCNSTVNAAITIAQQIKSTITTELADEGITVSIGIAVYPDHAHSAKDLIKTAEDALYKVNLARHNQIRVYSRFIDEIKEELKEELTNPKAIFEVFQTLLIIINARDRYTYGHSQRVAKYAESIGEELGLDSEELKNLKYAGFLHDIGKIEISREILNKKEPLTVEEWRIIKQHPLFGASILESFPDLADIVASVRGHHERYDGQGYPGGLQGEEIPLGARILAVADSYDAMISKRPYRNAFGKTIALQELVKEKGGQFDPVVVEAFLTVVDVAEQEIANQVS